MSTWALQKAASARASYWPNSRPFRAVGLDNLILVCYLSNRLQRTTLRLIVVNWVSKIPQSGLTTGNKRFSPWRYREFAVKASPCSAPVIHLAKETPPNIDVLMWALQEQRQAEKMGRSSGHVKRCHCMTHEPLHKWSNWLEASWWVL